MPDAPGHVGTPRAAARPDASIHLVTFGALPNFGDEMITRAWLRHLARVRPDAEVWLDTRFPANAAVLFRDLHPRLHVTDAIFRAVDDSGEGAARSPAEIITELGSPFYDLQLLQLRESTTIHLLGGGFVNRLWPENARLMAALRAAAAVSGARLVATGQGLSPFSGERFEGFEHVSVRDEESAAELGIERGYDDALLDVSPPAVLRRARRALRAAVSAHRAPEVMVCVQSDAVEDSAFTRMTAYVRACLRRWGVPREQVRYVEAIPGRDHAGYTALEDVVAPDGFVPFSAVWRGGLAMGPHQVWITSRYHHHLLAAAHGARGIALVGSSGYYDVKHRAVTSLGSRWRLATGGEDPVPRIADLRFPQGFDAACRAKAEEAARLYPARS